MNHIKRNRLNSPPGAHPGEYAMDYILRLQKERNKERRDELSSPDPTGKLVYDLEKIVTLLLKVEDKLRGKI